MKIINRNLVESKLFEADEDEIVEKPVEDKTIADIDPMSASVSDIADATQTAVEVESGGDVSISDSEAQKLAQEIKDTADDVGAGAMAVVPKDVDEPEDEYITENAITIALDRAYRNSKKFMRQGIKAGSNILISGLPGSGKTAIVESWVNKKMKSLGLVLVPVNATDPKIETAVNGMPLRDVTKPDQNALAYSFPPTLAPLMDPKNEGRCVLFVDEFNRQNDQKLRRAFLSLFNEKRNADNSLNFTKTLLFTVVCINPSCKQDNGASRLNQAEASRFIYNLIGYDSDTESARNYYNTFGANRLKKLGITLPQEKASLLKKVSDQVDELKDMSPEEIEKYYTDKDIDEELMIIDITEHILTNPEFAFDSESDLQNIYTDQKNILNQRVLTDAIRNAGGDKIEFLEWVDHYSNLLDHDKEMLQNVLSDYTLDLPALRREYGIDAGSGSGQGQGQGQGTNSGSSTGNGGNNKEDDDDLFGTYNQAMGQGSSVATAAAARQAVLDSIGDWKV